MKSFGVLLLVGVSGGNLGWARLTPQIVEGEKYCQSVQLTDRWLAPADADRPEQFASDRGDLSFRLDERDDTHVLVAKVATRGYLPGKAYSVNKYYVPITP